MNELHTLIDLLRHRAAHQTNQLAYCFLSDSGEITSTISYQQLDERARAIAVQLRKIATPGDRALLLFPAGAESLCALFGCLYAGIIAIPAPPLEESHRTRSLSRVRALLCDSRAALLLMGSENGRPLPDLAEELPSAAPLSVLDVAAIDDDPSDDWQPPRIDADSPAYLQYTSGSTTLPRGVVITHANVLRHCRMLQQSCGYDRASVTVTWMPYFHDYGLIEGLLEPLYNGTPCYAMSPQAFIKRPVLWLQTISQYRATHSQAPNFAYEFCVRRIPAEQLAGLDLSSWRAAGNGAEPINPRVLFEFTEKFRGCGFRWESFCPAYGLAEATLVVTFSPVGRPPRVRKFRKDILEQNQVLSAVSEFEDSRTLVGCGPPIVGTRVVIVDPVSYEACRPNEVGEVWVASDSIPSSYWQQAEATRETFQAYLKTTGEGPFLRTGDLGFLEGGELFIAGRIKDVIIIRGSNHHPQDIEWTVQQAVEPLHTANRAVFSVFSDDTERLVVAQEIPHDIGPRGELVDVVRRIQAAIVGEHLLDVYAIVLCQRGSLPKTSSGKIQRQLCRRNFLNGELQWIATWTAGQQIVVREPASTTKTF